MGPKCVIYHYFSIIDSVQPNPSSSCQPEGRSSRKYFGNTAKAVATSKSTKRSYTPLLADHVFRLYIQRRTYVVSRKVEGPRRRLGDCCLFVLLTCKHNSMASKVDSNWTAGRASTDSGGELLNTEGVEECLGLTVFLYATIRNVRTCAIRSQDPFRDPYGHPSSSARPSTDSRPSTNSRRATAGPRTGNTPAHGPSMSLTDALEEIITVKPVRSKPSRAASSGPG